MNYKAIEIFTSEQTRSGSNPTVDVVIEYVRSLKIAARCIVTRGIAGCYENGEVATGRLEALSFNMPVRIYIILPAAAADRVINDLNQKVEDGILVLHDLNVISHRTRNVFFPRQLLVRDVMTSDPKHISRSGSLREATELLLSSVFTGLPVVDEEGRPVGIITQGDLINRGGLPLRPGLLAEADPNSRESALTEIASHKAADAMTAPVVTINEDQPLAEAVDRMLEKKVKRLPVTDKTGRLTGMLSRIDIFQTVMREAPDWNTFRAQKIEVTALKTVKDIIRRDTYTVSADTPIDEVIRIIDRNDIQRVAVVDEGEKLLGLISDRDLLRYFKQEQPGILGMLARIKRRFRGNACGTDFQKCLNETTAGTVMNTELITVNEEMLIGDAVRLMTEKSLKRLPVLDNMGRFKGLISRDSLLRTGFGSPH